MSTIKVTGENHAQEVIASEVPVLVDFWAEWCGPCRAIAPDLEALSDELAGQVKVVKVNADEQPDLAAQYGVRSLPTLVIVKNGEAIDLRTGTMARSKMASWLKEVA